MMETNFNTEALKTTNYHKSYEEKRFLMGSEYITYSSINQEFSEAELPLKL
jgi:hypothetical protein